MMNYAPSLKVRAAATLELRRRAGRSNRVAPTFRGDNERIQHTHDREWMLAGPSETGKTWAALWRLDQLLSTTPGAQAALVRKLAVDIAPTVLVTYRRVVAMSGSGAKPFGGNHPEWYNYPNGARLYLGGIDRPGRILSGERDFIYVNQAEELDVDDWETLTTRTTGRGAVTKTPMLFGDCNPADPEHWILKRRNAGVLSFFTSRHENNPSLYTDDGLLTEQGKRTMQTLDSLTGARYSRLRLGEWVVGDEDEAFLPSMTLWDACYGALPVFDSRTPLLCALDAAVNGDTFGFVGVSKLSDRVAVRLVMAWEPRGGQALNYGQIEEEIRRDVLARFNVVQIAFDPHQAHYMAERLGNTVWCEPFNQGGDRLEADRMLLDTTVQRQIVQDGDDRLRQHIANANRKTDADGRRIRIVKRTPDKKIDLAVSLSMANYRIRTEFAL